MVRHMNASESEEMYLVTIQKLCEDSVSPHIPLPDLAEKLGLKAVSVNQMVKKLARSGLVAYEPYKGVELTPEGQSVADRILRNHRLWEVFLVQHLKIELEEADQMACEMEHVTSSEVADRLAEFLDHPRTCFHGKPIPPAAEGSRSPFQGISLTDLAVGGTGIVMQIEADEATTNFLFNAGIKLGVRISPIAVGSRDEILLNTESGHVNLAAGIASRIVVKPLHLSNTPENNEETMSLPLSDLHVGQKGIIESINFKGAARQRLLAMGLVKGETILVKRVAPLGDPIDFVIKGYDLSLRKSEAAKIVVSPLNA